jgi:hypothetical protein
VKRTRATIPPVAGGREAFDASPCHAVGVRVEVLFFDGCPSRERLLPRVRELALQAGAELALRRVETLEEAHALPGSPTVRVDGRDIEPCAAGRSDHGLTAASLARSSSSPRRLRRSGGCAARSRANYLVRAVRRASGSDRRRRARA